MQINLEYCILLYDYIGEGKLCIHLYLWTAVPVMHGLKHAITN